MKVGLYADPHFSQTSSIITGKQGSFSGRLDNLIKSFEWMNNLFKEKSVDMVVCLGDMTDKPILTAEEITAMSMCNLDEHYMIVGNHCRSDKDGKINSLSNYPHVFNEPAWISDEIYVLPYNHDLMDLKKLSPRPKIILSHNDIKGYDFGGGHISSEGYEIPDILASCDLYINGHLHNGGWIIKDRIMNLGNLSGMNFASCGGQWEPSVVIIDTETLQIEFFENPEAYRFKKLEIDTLPKVKGFLDNLSDGNYVVQLKVPDSIVESTRKLINQNSKVIASRILVYKTKEEIVEKIETVTDTRNVYDKFKDFIAGQDPKLSLKRLHEIIDEISEVEEGVI